VAQTRSKSSGSGARRGPIRRETPAERADRNLNELLQELRVALPGVQVLFAFLLTVPFTQRFAQITPLQEKLYFGILLATALSTALLIAPSAYHRLLFRQREKEHLVDLSNQFAIAGLFVLAVAMCGVVLLISDLLFKSPLPAIATGGMGAIFVVLWYVAPLIRRIRKEAQ
jgi:Family of unknown function (DUF6328)